MNDNCEELQTRIDDLEAELTHITRDRDALIERLFRLEGGA